MRREVSKYKGEQVKKWVAMRREASWEANWEASWEASWVWCRSQGAREAGELYERKVTPSQHSPQRERRRRRPSSDRVFTSESEGECCHLCHCVAHSAQVLVVISYKWVISDCPPSALVMNRRILKVESWTQDL